MQSVPLQRKTKEHLPPPHGLEQVASISVHMGPYPGMAEWQQGGALVLKTVWHRGSQQPQAATPGLPLHETRMAVIVFPEAPENTPCCRDSKDHDGFNDEAACQVGLTQEGTGPHPRGALSSYSCSGFDIHVLAEAALCGGGKLPQGVQAGAGGQQEGHGGW